MGTVTARIAFLVSAVVGCVFAPLSGAQEAPNYAGDLEEDDGSLIVQIEGDPRFPGGMVELFAGDTLVDATYWSGDLPFIKEYSLEPNAYVLNAEGQTEPLLLDLGSGAVDIIRYSINDYRLGTLEYESTAQGLKAYEANEFISKLSEWYGEGSLIFVKSAPTSR